MTQTFCAKFVYPKGSDVTRPNECCMKFCRQEVFQTYKNQTSSILVFWMILLLEQNYVQSSENAEIIEKTT